MINLFMILDKHSLSYASPTNISKQESLLDSDANSDISNSSQHAPENDCGESGDNLSSAPNSDHETNIQYKVSKAVEQTSGHVSKGTANKENGL